MIKKFNKSIKIIFIIILVCIIGLALYKYNKCSYTVVKVDKNNKKVETLKNSINKTKINKEEKKKTEVLNKKVSEQDAINIIRRKFPSKGGSCIKYEYDHDSVHQGKEFYVIHVFEDRKTHVATIGWFGVDKSTGRVYNEIFKRYED